MKQLPAGLSASLASGVTTLCTCWRLQRGDGAVFGFTNHDRALTFAGVIFEPSSGVTASETESALGLQVDTMEVEGALSSDAITDDDIALGLWDNAAVEIWRVDWLDTASRVILRRGSTGEVTRGTIAFTAELRSLAHELNQESGRTFQRPCDAVVGDARCGIDLASPTWRGSGTVIASADDRLLSVAGLGAFAEDWFNHGLLTWTSGENPGGKVEVASHLIQAGGAVMLKLWRRAARPVGIGDAFQVTAGCSKAFAECRSKFHNAANFRGFPHMPGNDATMAFAKRENENDGDSFFN
jgi:uncharacterized phage protein (TIGR02218 family)